jgi:hypothetical protein
MSFVPIGLETIDVGALETVDVGPGCTRIDLPSRDGVRLWVVDMEPGAVWPHVDHHDSFGEDVFVVSGEMIEGEERLGPGTFLKFGDGSSHRPRTDIGVRLFGLNMKDRFAVSGAGNEQR